MRRAHLWLPGSLLAACTGGTDTPADTDASADGVPFDFLADAGPTFVAADAVGEAGLLLDRLDVLLAGDADAQDLSAALDVVGGQVAASRPGLPWITVQIPRVDDLDAAAAVADALEGEPGVLVARPAWLAVPQPPGEEPLRAAPPGVGGSTNSYLGDQRFYAAWNAQDLATTKVQVWVADFFTSNTPPDQLSAMRFVGPSPAEPPEVSAGESLQENHGWWVASVLGADNDDRAPVGTHPEPARTLDLVGINLASAGSSIDTILLLDRHLPTDAFFVLNTSFGFSEGVPTEDRALAALAWREVLLRRTVPFLHTASAGNEGYTDPVELRFNSFATAQTTLDDLGRLLTETNRADFDAAWAQSVARRGTAVEGIQGRTLIVGSSGYGGAESSFSNRGSDVRMIGESVTGVCGLLDRTCIDGSFGRLKTGDGTSAAAPAAAGLAAWLHAIDPTLEAVDLVDLLLAQFDGAWVDALNATLALEARGVPVRRAWLDHDRDGAFDPDDATAILAEIDAEDGVDRIWPRGDLNGDGFASATTRKPIDLDGDGTLGAFTVQVPGDEAAVLEDRIVDEASLSDLDVLCWGAYAGPFTGEEEGRDEVLAGRCRPSRSGVITHRAVTTSRPGCNPASTDERLDAEVRISASGDVLAVSGTYTLTSTATAGACTLSSSWVGPVLLSDFDPDIAQTRTAQLSASEGPGTLMLPLRYDFNDSGTGPCAFVETGTRREYFSLPYVREPDGRFTFDRTETITTLGCLDEVIEVSGEVVPE